MPKYKIADFNTFQTKMTEYLSLCKEEGLLATFDGLALYMGYSRKSTLLDQCSRGSDFEDAIEKFHTILLDIAQNRLVTKGESIAANIFFLKNNCGRTAVWADKREFEANGVTITVIPAFNNSKGNSED